MSLRIGFWFGILLISVFAAHWGAERLSSPLKKLRRQWGLTAVAGGTFIGLAAASPEIAINTVSALRDVGSIGLGNSFGANVLSMPLMVTAAYLAVRTTDVTQQRGEDSKAAASQNPTDSPEQLPVRRTAVTVLAIPYILILVLVAVLTLPAPWRGLQPLDGWLLAIAYLIYAGQALVRGRQEGENVQWTRKEVGLAVAGVIVLAVGSYFAIRATEQLVAAFGISEIVGGLFITGTMSTLPELFATWSIVKSGQFTSGTTGVVTDNAVTMTVALVPLAFVTVPIDDFQLYWVSFAFLVAMPLLYTVFIYWSPEQSGFSLWQVIAFDLSYLVFLGVIIAVIF
ncbi:sodium:calcium antiporter [Saliphagus infecundisoli]|uniref:Sodium:calcium antiporter n=1 Tax=Saliphagus infecundisoli TaxID=1849069 RepID=A0ABD5QIQ2_9EURY|nr:hypothetical protein [Saliphagus infecundisoli]